MNKVFGFIAKEFREILPALIYFMIAFHVLAITQALLLQRYGIEPAASVAATIMALIVAKAILVADALPLIDRFPDRPLIWNVVWKTLIYGLVAFAFRYLEEWIPRIGDAGGMACGFLDGLLVLGAQSLPAVFVDEEGQLDIRPVKIIRSDANHVYLSGESGGQRIVLTSLENPVNGMRVRTSAQPIGDDASQSASIGTAVN